MRMFRDENKQGIMQEVKEIKADIAERTPPNEATTCSWVIEPLLLAAGYRRTDWVKESPDSTGNKPDYTVLPLTEHRWLLEAKAWSHRLSEQDANQLTSYANTHNIRWAVLTNGKEWQLYDASIFGTVAERLQAQAGIEQPDALADLLLALSPRSVQQGVIQQFARRSRMDREIRAQFADENSPIVQAIVERLKAATKIDYAPEEVVEYLLRFTSAPAITSRSPGIAQPSDEDLKRLNLSELYSDRNKMSHTKPVEVGLPSGISRKVDSWAEALVEVIKYLLENHEIDIPRPLRTEKRASNRYLLNYEPKHPDNTEFQRYGRKQIEISGRNIFLNTNLSTPDTIRELYLLVDDVREAPAQYFIAYKYDTAKRQRKL